MNPFIDVVKVGGSLLDLPDLAERINRWRLTDASPRVVVVVGGGAAADIVRDWDRRHDIGEAASHHLAVRAMQFNTHLVAAMIERTSRETGWSAAVARELSDCDAIWRDGAAAAIVDPVAVLAKRERSGRTTPKRWTFTSDSIAAAVACDLDAEWRGGGSGGRDAAGVGACAVGVRLTLLKSTLPGEADGERDRDAGKASRVAGDLVDADFAAAAAGLPAIRLVNLRATPAVTWWYRGGP